MTVLSYNLNIYVTFSGFVGVEATLHVFQTLCKPPKYTSIIWFFIDVSSLILVLPTFMSLLEQRSFSLVRIKPVK